jgi:hypothetical protein
MRKGTRADILNENKRELNKLQIQWLSRYRWQRRIYNQADGDTSWSRAEKGGMTELSRHTSHSCQIFKTD